MDCTNDKVETDKGNQSPRATKSAQAEKLFQTGVLLIYGRRKLIDKAIKCIQRAINLDDQDYRYWQLLGEAYYQRGSLNPAINCFMKSLSLAEEISKDLTNDEQEKCKSNCTYSMMRMSDIRLSVGHLEEALAGYNEIIEKDPTNAAALVGCTKTNLQLARNSFSAGLVKLGHTQCMTALESSLKAIKLCPHLCLTWKLAADCCLIQYVFGQRSQASTYIQIDFPGSDEQGLKLEKYTCLDLAQQFLCKSLSIEGFENSVSLWHNLGITLYLKSTLSNQPSERESTLKLSLKCLLKALDCDKSNSQVMNSIGVVAFHLDLLKSAQTFLIKSIQSNMSTSEIQFSNLGYIFLQKGEFRLASVAFGRSQAEEPLYFRSWLGNAIVNDQNNVDNLSQLRHCHKLENNYESQVMYATKVVTLPHVESYTKDVVSALDCSKRMINYDRNSLELNNTLGLLYERVGFDGQAKRHFELAYRIQPNNGRIIMNRLRQDFTQSCYVLDDSNATDRTKEELINAAEKLSKTGNKEYLLNFIYFLFKNGDYSDINTRMTRLIERLDPSKVDQKIGAQILLALAAKADGQDFKSWLFKNIIDSQSKWCIELLINNLCLMILGTTTNDDQVVELVSKDLTINLITYLSSQKQSIPELLRTMNGFWIQFVILCSIFCLKDQSRLIRQLVALFPTIPDFWVYLGLSFIVGGNEPSLAIYCIEQANVMDSSPDLRAVGDMLLTILISSNPQQDIGKNGTCLKRLSRATHKCPYYGHLWMVLLNINAKSDQVQTSYIEDQKRNLFNLAIDHVLKTISAKNI